MTNGNDLKEESFKLVTSRRKKKQNQSTSNQNIVNLNSNEPDLDEIAVIRRIKDTEIDIKQSEYYKDCVQKLQSTVKQFSASIKEIICFGIGHFSECSIARHQFAFIVAIKNDLNVEKITYHEPILYKAEVNIIKSLDCEVFEENLEGKISVTGEPNTSTLIYSPHCPKQLTNNFLWKNWNKHQLSRIVFIGNSFTNLLNSTPSRLLEIDANFIVKIQPYTKETVFNNTFKYTDIFNDTALHTFPSENLSTLSDPFWNEQIIEPIYSNSIELITSELIAKLSVN